MDRPKEMSEVPESVKMYVEFLEDGRMNHEESLETAAAITESWRAAYEKSEAEKQALIKQRDLAMRQGSQVQFALERTEANLREAHKKEGVLAALLESEKAKARAQANKAGPGGEP